MIGRLFTLLLAVAGMAMLGGAATAQTVMVADGRTVAFDSLPMVAKFQGRFRLPSLPQGSNAPWLTVMTSPSFCPSAWSFASGGSDLERAEAVCTAISRARLEDYGAATRERCKCVRAIEGPTLQSLKAVSPLVDDADYYTIITLVVTRPAGRERLRGFLAAQVNGAFRIFNENRQPVCSGKGLSEGGEVQFTCFGGAVRARGTYQSIADNTSTSPSYGIGSFQLSDGARLDIAVNIIDSDLRARRPRFPD